MKKYKVFVGSNKDFTTIGEEIISTDGYAAALVDAAALAKRKYADAYVKLLEEIK